VSLGHELPSWQDEPARSPAAVPLVQSFVRHRVECRGVAESTGRSERNRVQSFVDWLGDRSVGLGDLGLADMDAYVLELLERLAPKTVAGICSTLRAFLRFLHGEAILEHDLSASVAMPKIRFGDHPPRALAWEDVRRILGAVDRRTRIGRRDYAMLLMVSLYGLGAGEVVALRPEDVYWRRREIAFVRQKIGRELVLPLLPPVALALVDYLRHGRPNHTRSRTVFVRFQAPYTALGGSGAIRHRIVLYAGRAGVDAAYLGSHVLRHSHATRQIELGAPVKAVGDILGHSRPETTGVYVGSATGQFRRISLPVLP
jgi:site-specific recombinase XerD